MTATPPPAIPRLGVHGQEGESVGGDGAVGDPGRLLAVDDPLVAVQLGGHVEGDLGIAELLGADEQAMSEPCWGSVMAQQPMYLASRSWAKGTTISASAPGCRVSAATRREREGEGGDAEGDREVGAAPAHLLGHDVPLQGAAGWRRPATRAGPAMW